MAGWYKKGIYIVIIFYTIMTSSSGLEIFGSREGFHAKHPFFKLLLYETEFFLYKMVYDAKGNYEEYLFSGLWEEQDENLLVLKTTNYEIQKMKGFDLTHEQTPVKKTITVHKKIKDNMKILIFKAFGRKIELKSYIEPPDPLYLILPGAYNIENEYYGSEFLLSTPLYGEYGDFNDYFHLAIMTMGECGYGQYGSYFEIKGYYRIDNKKLFLYYSFTQNQEGIDNPAEVALFDPVSVLVDYVIEDGKVQLSFHLGGVNYMFEKRIDTEP